MHRIPTDTPVQIREHAETTLVGHAQQMDPRHLSLVAEKLINTLDPDGDYDPRDPTDRTELALGGRDTRTGLTAIRGKLDDHAVAVFIAATDPHAKPRPEADGIKDPRSASTRLAQALTTVLADHLTAGTGPVQGGERPHVTMTIGYDALTGRLGPATLDATAVTVPAATARRLLCDCDLIPAVLGSAGEPLDHRPGHPHLAHRDPPRRGPAGPRMRVPRLRPTGPLVRHPPPQVLGGRWTHQPGKWLLSLRFPSHPDPSGRLADPDGQRRPPRDHPTQLDRPRPTPPPQPAAPAPAMSGS